MDYEQLYAHVAHLAENLPVHQREMLHQRLAATLPVPVDPVVVAATPVPSAPSPSVLRPSFAEWYGNEPSSSSTLISNPPPTQENKQDDHSNTHEPAGSLTQPVSVSWVRRCAARLLDMAVMLLLLPRPLKRRLLLIVGSVAIDMVWHARSPGQTLGKRLLGLQVCTRPRSLYHD